MTITVPAGQGQMTMSNEVAKSSGPVKFINHSDVLEAFNQCQFQSQTQVATWLKRFNDATKGISRRALIRQMISEHKYH